MLVYKIEGSSTVKRVVAGYPRPINEEWEGVTGPLDAVLYKQANSGHPDDLLFFFKVFKINKRNHTD